MSKKFATAVEVRIGQNRLRERVGRALAKRLLNQARNPLAHAGGPDKLRIFFITLKMEVRLMFGKTSAAIFIRQDNL